jgi:hypothetical protein
MRAVRALVAGCVASALLLSVVAAQDRTVEGTLVDAKCYLGQGEKGNDHGGMQGCGTMCLKGGSTAGVVTKTGSFHALVAPAPALAEYVGQTVRVSGTERNGALLAKKVEVNKGGKWQEVKLGGMM